MKRKGTKEQIRAKRERDAWEKARERTFRQIRNQRGASKWEVDELLDEWELNHSKPKGRYARRAKDWV